MGAVVTLIGYALSALIFGWVGGWVERNYGFTWTLALAVFWVTGSILPVLDSIMGRLNAIAAHLDSGRQEAELKATQLQEELRRLSDQG